MSCSVVELLPPTRSPAMRETLAMASRAAADPEATILLLGETGVGKGWLARRIHAQSPRRDRPYVELNCASMTKELVESELFGHVRGSFTGAEIDKRGLVEEAHGGTLFLDEISELPIEVQTHLLTFLDTKCFRALGGIERKSVDVRIIAATNGDLSEAVGARRFRADLFHRLSVLPFGPIGTPSGTGLGTSQAPHSRQSGEPHHSGTFSQERDRNPPLEAKESRKNKCSKSPQPLRADRVVPVAMKTIGLE